MLGFLRKEDVAFFHENGYIIVPNAVPPKNLQRVIDAL
jgi:hypothetical protein